MGQLTPGTVVTCSARAQRLFLEKTTLRTGNNHTTGAARSCSKLRLSRQHRGSQRSTAAVFQLRNHADLIRGEGKAHGAANTSGVGSTAQRWRVRPETGIRTSLTTLSQRAEPRNTQAQEHTPHPKAYGTGEGAQLAPERTVEAKPAQNGAPTAGHRF